MKKIYRFLTCVSLVTGVAGSPVLAQTPAASERGAAKAQQEREREKENKQAGALNAQDRQFLTEALEGNRAETELAKLAEQKATSQPVRELAQTLQTDHARANDTLESIAGKVGVPAEPAMKPKHKQLQDRLSRLEGDAFDRAYASEMVKDHEKDIARYEKASRQLQNAELKAYASETLPHLKQHLELARSAQNPTPKTR
jgi:putative membrane protein